MVIGHLVVSSLGESIVLTTLLVGTVELLDILGLLSVLIRGSGLISGCEILAVTWGLSKCP